MKNYRLFPDIDDRGNRKAVCRKCSLVMQDIEPSGAASFQHFALDHQKRALKCPNDRKEFDESSPEVEPFLPKSARRRNKRLGIRA